MSWFVVSINDCNIRGPQEPDSNEGICNHFINFQNTSLPLTIDDVNETSVPKLQHHRQSSGVMLQMSLKWLQMTSTCQNLNLFKERSRHTGGCDLLAGSSSGISEGILASMRMVGMHLPNRCERDSNLDPGGFPLSQVQTWRRTSTQTQQKNISLEWMSNWQISTARGSQEIGTQTMKTDYTLHGVFHAGHVSMADLNISLAHPWWKAITKRAATENVFAASRREEQRNQIQQREAALWNCSIMCLLFFFFYECLHNIHLVPPKRWAEQGV